MHHYIFFLPNLARGGVARTVACLAEGLAAKKINVTVVILHEQLEQLNELQPGRIRCLLPGVPAYAKALFFAPLALIRLFKLLKAQPGATVSAHGLLPNLMVAACKHLLRAQLDYVGFQHDSPSGHYASASGLVKKRILQWSFRRSKVVACVSRGVSEELIKERVCSASKTVVLYNGHNITRIRELAHGGVSPAFQELRPHYSHVALMIGRLAPQKDYDTAIQVARILAPERVAIAVIGDGPELSRLQEVVQKEGVSNFYFLGARSNPFPELANSDLLLLTSLHESFGNVIVEALALGKPVVSTDCPSGPREILDGGRYGALCPVGDAEALANAVKLTVQSNTLQSDTRRSAILQRSQSFDVSRQVERYIQLLGLQQQV